MYRQLTEGERYILSAYKRDKQSLRSIAKLLGRSPSTLSREVRRNATVDDRKPNPLYIPSKAQEQANEIVTNARKESEQTLREAEEKAAEILDQAQKSAQELAMDAASYADQVFELVEANLSQSLDTVRKGHEDLKQQFRR